MTEEKPFIISKLEEIRRLSNTGVEFWLARELQPILGYSKWENFFKTIERAKEACRSNGHKAENHFPEHRKMVMVGSGAERPQDDVILSRYACYLIAMNGDPAKAEIAAAQNYFAVETRKSELISQIIEAEKRIELRERLKTDTKHLIEAAREAGVVNFGEFNNKGYEGLYGGYDAAELKSMKGLNANDSLPDYMGRAELAANSFRATQTELRIKSENIEGQNAVSQAHFEVGAHVRETMKKTGSVMPEDLPIETDIKPLKEVVDKFRGNGYLKGS